MAAPVTIDAFLDLVRKSGVVELDALEGYLQGLRDAGKLPAVPGQLAGTLVRDGILTQFQARQFLQGRWRGLIISGKYQLLEHLGTGGMGSVFLCEHKVMRRRVALKMLPRSQAQDPSSLDRFRREARAVAALDHPNLVRAHDIDCDGKQHFLVMEYVDGDSLQNIVAKQGPLDVTRAAHYLRQVALGLHQAHQAGLVHRDIKPGNLLLDRSGVVKILDMGLALFFHDKSDNITKQYDERSTLGTADYLAPEQAIDSHEVDIRADLYSLGATFYFLLTGSPPFGEGTIQQKLIWHQMRTPKPVREIRPEVPEGLAAVLDKLLAKDPAQRYQNPAEVYEALAPWTQTPIPPPPEKEMPRLSLRARGNAPDSMMVQPLAPGSTIDTAFPTLPGRPPALPAPTTPPRHIVEPATTIRREDSTAITASVTPVPADQAPTAPMKPPQSRRFPWLVAALTLLALGTVAAVSAIAVAVVALRNPPVVESHQPGPTTPEPRPVSEPNKTPPPADPAVSVRFENNSYRVRTPTYEAVVENDGCLNSLRVGGVEFLHPGGVPLPGKTVSRGSYFYSDRDGAIKLPNLKQPAANVIAATGDKLSITYEFGADSLLCKLTNATDFQMPFYVVFDPASVTEVFSEDGERALVPVALRKDDPQPKKWATTTWVAGNSWLTLRGGNTLWGPWDKARLQVWQATLENYESRTLKMEMGVLSDKKPAHVPARPVLNADGFVLKRDYNARHVFTQHYEASVGDDGFMPSLRGDGVEFLKANVDVSRGVYLLQTAGAWPTFAKLEQPSGSVIAAEGDTAAIRHAFAPDRVTWTVENRTDAPMAFFIVFDPAVRLVRDGQGEWAKLPAASKPGDPAEKWQKTSWFAGKSRLTLTGGNRVWGPWQEKYQVWEASLAAHEKRTVTAEVGAITAEEAARFTQLIGVKPGEQPDIPLTSPLDYQVFQRASRREGPFVLRGRVVPACDRAEVRVTGKSLQGSLPGQWQALPLLRPTQNFDQTLPLAAGGWYKVEVRALKGDQVVAQAAVAHIGVGEVFVGAGQSNSTNCGQERIQQTSGMVSSFSGSDWRLADDPQPGVHDNTEGGSYWPAFGDALYEKYHVPIGVVSAGQTGTSVTQWQPDGELFRWLMTRVGQLGAHGFRGLQWHQGESDVGMTSDEYAERLTRVIEQSKKAAGWDFPWFVAQVSYHNPSSPSFPSTRDAQKRLWEKGIALEGPDTDTLTGDQRDLGGMGIHFSPKGLRAHGRLWAEKVGVYLDKQLKD